MSKKKGAMSTQTAVIGGGTGPPPTTNLPTPPLLGESRPPPPRMGSDHPVGVDHLPARPCPRRTRSSGRSRSSWTASRRTCASGWRTCATRSCDPPRSPLPAIHTLSPPHYPLPPACNPVTDPTCTRGKFASISAHSHSLPDSTPFFLTFPSILSRLVHKLPSMQWREGATTFVLFALFPNAQPKL